MKLTLKQLEALSWGAVSHSKLWTEASGALRFETNSLKPG